MGWLQRTEEALVDKKVLVVGAGGIGCELLKNLVLSRFRHIEVIDLDTIDVSNLNRQFLFRRQHVGRPKAEVAVEAVKEALGTFPDAHIKFYHDSVFKFVLSPCSAGFRSEFNLAFFQGFDLVMNALDNRAARNHVNRLCIAGRVPLIESGTSGYLGQISIILRGVTPCYECVPKPSEQKTFPGCTIRNTPSEHIHCTVWAKHAFNQLFGEIDFDDEVSPDATDTGKRDEDGEAVEGNGSAMDTDDQEGEASENGSVSNGSKSTAPSTRVWAEECNYHPKKIFQKLFGEDIRYLLTMKHLWMERRPPRPLNWDEIPASSRILQGVSITTEVWNVGECVDYFADTMENLRERKGRLNYGEVLTWDKDDEDAMRFVVACANLRAYAFHIPLKSLFEIKSMAGNIIPAIATTNAIVAGMIVIEAVKLLLDKEIPTVSERMLLTKPNPRNELFGQVSGNNAPNKNCIVCSEEREIYVRVNTEQMTIKILQDKVLKNALHMVAPDVSNGGNIIISSEEGECEELLPKKLQDLSLIEGTLLECDDFQQQLSFRLGLFHNQKLKEDEFELIRDSGPKKEEEEVEQPEEDRKRKLIEGGDAEPEEAKKAKLDA